MSEKLLLGVARTNITPEVGCNLFGYSPDVISKSVHDDLKATAFYFESGENKALLISIDLCSMHTDLADEIRANLELRGVILTDTAGGTKFTVK